MGFNWTDGSATGLQAELQAFQDKVLEVAVESMAETVEQGKAEMKFIMRQAHTRTGQERVRSGRGAYAGRIDTGHMDDHVKASVEVPDITKVVGQYGWLEVFETYFGEQEEGFNHPLSGNWVEGMHSFQSWTEAVAGLKRRLAERGFVIS